jgi:hypothetical protein
MSDERDSSIAAAHDRDSNRSEGDSVQPRQPFALPDGPVANDSSIAYDTHMRSITRLHDDELSCVLPFLALKDLAQLVRCSRRFNGVARKDRSRGLQLEGEASIVSPPSSSLSHHVSSLQLRHRFLLDAPVSPDTRHQPRALPRLTAMQFILSTDIGISLLLHQLSRAIQMVHACAA